MIGNGKALATGDNNGFVKTMLWGKWRVVRSIW